MKSKIASSPWISAALKFPNASFSIAKKFSVICLASRDKFMRSGTQNLANMPQILPRGYYSASFASAFSMRFLYSSSLRCSSRFTLLPSFSKATAMCSPSSRAPAPCRRLTQRRKAARFDDICLKIAQNASRLRSEKN